MSCGHSAQVLEQFAAVSDYPKLFRALTLVSCGNLRSPATAPLGLALLRRPHSSRMTYQLGVKEMSEAE
ncbi:hypothetical protein CHLRE_12g486702v5 [Chlamydomonas reinhardtii]|uniref:Uncharacterized protein n=1 Tax=Chlamydomonas reinhardtii TaxID=3055 RepID=A0A2K3D2D2_CHLRE|nr:uncharacterized protein CHLRE_12g486702v5 [Chlamydomonas reinhardtii]PNW74696.1 hypothetical protein CHLRE_12g486702v5 [Chlamydomonas reinhardtii]